MKGISISFGAALLCSGMIFGQTGNRPSIADTMPATTAQSAGTTWTGLLIAAACDASPNMPTSTARATDNMPASTGNADRMTDITTARKSTPMNESNTTYEQSVNQADRNSIGNSAATVTTPRGTPTDMAAQSSVPSADRQSRSTANADDMHRASMERSDATAQSNVGSSNMNARTTDNDMNRRTSANDSSMTRTTTNSNTDVYPANSATTSDMNRTSKDMSRRTTANDSFMTARNTNSASSDVYPANSATTSDMNRNTVTSNDMDRRTSTTGVNGVDRNSTASNRSTSDDSWSDAQQASQRLSSGCRITQATSSFALRTPDGQIYRFDEASNSRIREQLNGRVAAHQSKIFRVVVRGNSDGGTITLDSIQM